MKLSNLAAPTTTTFEIVQLNGKPSGVFITANTPDSSEWVKAEKKYSKPNQKSSIILGNKGKEPRIEIDNEASETRMKCVIAMVTDITGLDEWKFSPEAATKLLNEAQYKWIYQQLEEHLSDRANYFLG